MLLTTDLYNWKHCMHKHSKWNSCSRCILLYLILRIMYCICIYSCIKSCVSILFECVIIYKQRCIVCINQNSNIKHTLHIHHSEHALFTQHLLTPIFHLHLHAMFLIKNCIDTINVPNTSPKLSFFNHCRLLSSCPIATYHASDTCRMTSRVTQKMNVFQERCMHWIL